MLSLKLGVRYLGELEDCFCLDEDDFGGLDYAMDIQGMAVLLDADLDCLLR